MLEPVVNCEAWYREMIALCTLNIVRTRSLSREEPGQTAALTKLSPTHACTKSVHMHGMSYQCQNKHCLQPCKVFVKTQLLQTAGEIFNLLGDPLFVLSLVLPEPSGSLSTTCHSYELTTITENCTTCNTTFFGTA